MSTTLPTVTAPTEDRWTITPQGRSALNAASRGQRYALRVAARVGRAIHASGIPAVEVASKAGMSASTLRRRLAGHISFTPSEVVRIAEVLDLEPLAFFTEGGQR
ncbi:helix-turn-helix domain-containing protein [Actinomyces polynesiensis]|uniref:helix-turn-helix domain-containing protein n=1 Tax=Actinomyces polynesiensis TaxID=1325934 RepID=UPI0005BA8D8B|nr:helix-turn-helix transcriptional regulator [Actinomyces polynesiensis]